MAVEYDLELLKILDSLPTFSPLIDELALERNNMAIPHAYLDLTPSCASSCALLKGRIRPLIVAAYGKSSVGVEKAVEAGDKPYGEIAKFSKFLLKCKRYIGNSAIFSAGSSRPACEHNIAKEAYPSPALPTFGDERAIGARLQPATNKMLIARY